MAKNDRLTDAHRAFIHTAGFAAGIVPMENTAHDMRRALATLPEEEQRKLKRKFRKLWRKLVRAQAAKASKGQKANLEARVGKGKKVPTRNERNERKRIVAQHLEEKAVKPMLERFYDSSQKASAPTDK